MNRVRRCVRAVLFTLLGVACWLGIPASASQAAVPTEIVMGYAVQLSGGLSVVGQLVDKAHHLWASHVNAGGGILCPLDAFMLFAAGADSVFLGSIAMLRPWRMKATIALARKVGEKTDAVRMHCLES